MDTAQIRSLKPELKKYLKGFADCFSRSDTRGHLFTYVAAQLSDLPVAQERACPHSTHHRRYALVPGAHPAAMAGKKIRG